MFTDSVWSFASALLTAETLKANERLQQSIKMTVKKKGKENEDTLITFCYDLYLSNVSVSECTRVMITLFTVSRAHLQHNYIVRMNKQYTVIVRGIMYMRIFI